MDKKSANINLITKEVVFTLVLFFVGWFLNRITQKLQYKFVRNLDGGWVSAQNGLN